MRTHTLAPVTQIHIYTNTHIGNAHTIAPLVVIKDSLCNSQNFRFVNIAGLWQHKFTMDLKWTIIVYKRAPSLLMDVAVRGHMPKHKPGIVRWTLAKKESKTLSAEKDYFYCISDNNWACSCNETNTNAIYNESIAGLLCTWKCYWVFPAVFGFISFQNNLWKPHLGCFSSSSGVCCIFTQKKKREKKGKTGIVSKRGEEEKW